ncbi:MAG: Major facilitator superfamily [Microgenomates group bacterium GW2011_GWA1_48_10]|nr:MAG: Major facilitator superfamily [Microgenomates group bacterium GW2011_GWA1_48_10]
MGESLRGITWRYYLYSFLTGLTFYTAALIPFYTDWGHISLTQVQFLQAWLMFWAFVLEIPTGVIADRFGRKISVVLGCFITFLSFLLYGTIPNFSAFLLAEFFAAAGLALMSGASEALLYDSLREEKKETKFKNIFGRSFSLGQVSAIIAAPLGGFIASRFGLNIPMLITAFPSLIAALVLLTTKEPLMKDTQEKEKNYLNITKRGISTFIHNKLLRTLAINGILVYTGAYFLIWLYQPQLKNLGIAIIYFGFVRALFALSGMIFSHNLQLTEKLFKSGNNFFRITTFITILSLVLIAVFPSLITIVLAIILIGGLGQARFTALNSYMNDQIPSEQRATTLSSISMLNRILLIVLNPAVGFMADHSLRGAFIFVAALSLIAIIFIPIRLPKTHAPEKP